MGCSYTTVLLGIPKRPTALRGTAHSQPMALILPTVGGC